MAKSFKQYLGAPKRRLKLYWGSAEELGYKGFAKAKVALDIWWWHKIQHYKPESYVFYGFNKYKSSYRKLFLDDYDQYITYNRFNGAFRFGKGGQYEDFGKDIINRDWIYVDKSGIEAVKDFIAKNEKVIFKPNRGSCGKGVFVVSAKDSAAAIEKEILSVSGKDYLCEQFIAQHPALSALHADSVNSIRVLVLNDHGNIKVIAATLKIGSGKNVVDNLRNGGCAANINVENGIVDTPFADLDGKNIFFSVNGIGALGFQIPNWDKVLEIAKKATLICKGNVVLGFDIAVTEDGAALIEANNRPGTRIVQSFDKKPKGELIRGYCKKYKKELKKIPKRKNRRHKSLS